MDKGSGVGRPGGLEDRWVEAQWDMGASFYLVLFLFLFYLFISFLFYYIHQFILVL